MSMANVTKVLASVEHRWPNGTSVSLYRRRMQEGQWVADGAAVASATVTNGVLSFANVPDDGGGYIAVGTVSGKTVAATASAGAISWATRH